MNFEAANMLRILGFKEGDIFDLEELDKRINERIDKSDFNAIHIINLVVNSDIVESFYRIKGNDQFEREKEEQFETLSKWVKDHPVYSSSEDMKKLLGELLKTQIKKDGEKLQNEKKPR